MTNVLPMAAKMANYREAEGFSSPEVCEVAGISYRQLDYWIRTKRIHAIGEDSPGSGIGRRFAAPEIRVITVVRELLDAGLSLDVAFAAGRQVVETGAPVVLADRLITIWAAQS